MFFNRLNGKCQFILNSIILFIFLSLVVISPTFASTETGIKVADIDFLSSTNRVNGDSLFFSRDSAAYERDGTKRSANVLRTDLITVASPIVQNRIDSYEVMAATANHVYFKSFENQKQLYYSSGPDSPLELAHTFPSTINSMYVTSQDTLLVALFYTTGTGGTVYRQDAEGNWSLVLTTAGEKTFVFNWGWTELNGRIFVAEYGPKDTTDNARRVYMSEDDGKTWVIIHEPESVYWRHLHTIVAAMVNGQTRVYLCYGDRASRAMFYLSEPCDGTNIWPATEIPLTTLAMQNTGGIWIPQKNAIVWAAEGHGYPMGLIIQNLSDNTFRYTLRTEIQRDDYYLPYYFLSMTKIGDLYFAAGEEFADPYNHTGVWASSDGENWCRITNLTSEMITLAGLGPKGNLWYCSEDYKSYYLPIPNVYTFKGALIERASDQRQDDLPPTISSDETKLDSSYYNDCWTENSSVQWQNNNGPVTSRKEYLSYGIREMRDISTGDVCYAAAWYKGRIGDPNGNHTGIDKGGALNARVEIFDSANTSNTNIAYTRVYPTDSWQRVILPVKSTFNHTVGRSRMKFAFYTIADEGPDDQEFDVLIDAVIYEKAASPAEWHSLEVPRDADILSYEPNSVSSDFTDIFTVGFRFSDTDCGSSMTGDDVSYVYLRTYAQDNNNFFAVVYDVYDAKIKLIQKNSGTPEVLAESSSINFFRDQSLNIAVIKQGVEFAKLLVWFDGHFEAIEGSSGIQHALNISYWGSDPSGNQGGSLVFLRSEMWNNAKDVYNAKQLMQWPKIDHSKKPAINRMLQMDFNEDGIVNLKDFALFTKSWLDSI